MAGTTSTRSRAGFLIGSAAALFVALSPTELVSQSRSQQYVPADSHHAASLPPASSHTQPPAPIVRPSTNTGVQMSADPNPAPIVRTPGLRAGNPALKGEHLGQWMMQHNNLTSAQQQSALEKEPGFHDLPPATQQRMRDRLSQLSTMAPDQRQRILQHNELMERLPPEQRAEIRSAMLQLSNLPPDQRRIVAHAFHELRGMPPAQRIPALNERYRNLNQQQRLTLTQLMHIEPLLPPDEHP